MHCGKPVSGPHGDAPGKYHYPVPEAKHIELRAITGVMLHHACEYDYFNPDSD